MFSAPIQRELTRLFGGGAGVCEVNDVLHMSRPFAPARCHLVRATSARQVRRLITFATDAGIRVLMLGKGHSKRAVPDDRPVVFLSITRQPLLSTITSASATLAAGVAWQNVERSLNVVGLRVPVTTDYLGLTVAGTVSQGGYGIDSITHGMQADGLNELRAITPSGEVVSCDLGNPLFQFSVAGVLTLAAIVTVTTRLVTSEPTMRLATFRLGRLEHFVEIVQQVLEDCDRGICTADLTWFPRGRGLSCRIGLRCGNAGLRSREVTERCGAKPYSIEIVTGYRMSLHRSVGRWYRRFQYAGKVWLDYVVPLEQARAFCADVETFCRRPHISTALECAYMIPIVRPAVSARVPFAAAAVPGQRYILFGLYFMPVETVSAAERIVADARETLLWRCVALGGRPYQQSRHDLTPKDMLAIYGEPFRTAVAYGLQLDPSEIFESWSSLEGALKGFTPRQRGPMSTT